MSNVANDALARAHWLAELQGALGEALELATRLSQSRFSERDAVYLRQEILALCAEVEDLRRARPVPNWSKRARSISNDTR